MNGFSSVGVEGPNNRRFTHNAPAGPPCVPSNFHVEKIIGNSSLKLSWQPVTIDSNGCSNGVKVTGYRVSKFCLYMITLIEGNRSNHKMLRLGVI